jgi:hypothetical protein
MAYRLRNLRRTAQNIPVFLDAMARPVSCARWTASVRAGGQLRSLPT